jgi:hypothetical protein
LFLLVCFLKSAHTHTAQQQQNNHPLKKPTNKKQSYNGSPHWGKGVARVFMHPTCNVGQRLAASGRLAALQTLRAASDPRDAFVSPLLASVLAGAAYTPSPRCALSGDCYCSESSHCAAGFACVPSIAFPEHKVCKAAALVAAQASLAAPGR